MADFIFRVDHVHLSEAQQEKIASAIQGAVLTELARLDLHGDTRSKTTQAAVGPSGGECIYIPHNWKGGMLIKALEVADAVNTQLTVTTKAAESRAA